MSLVAESVVAPASERTAPPRVQLFGVDIHVINMQHTVATILDWVETPGKRCRYIVTPNVDHVILLQHHAGLRKAYAEASLVLADGWPVVLASRCLGRPLPGRVPGSDLVPALFATRRPMSVFLLGAAPGVADCAATRVRATWPAVRVVGTHGPPLGFETDSRENSRILRLLDEARPDLLVVGLGAPKQELWVHAHRDQIPAKVALCVGATIDFLAGRQRRAPTWMRLAGLEWLHRMLSNPRRLAGRYARNAWIFPRLFWHEWRNQGQELEVRG